MLFALARLGATLVSINTRYRSEEVSHILRKSAARLMVCQPGFRKLNFAEILSGIAPETLPALKGVIVLTPMRTPPALLGKPVYHFPASAANAAAPGPDLFESGCRYDPVYHIGHD